MSGEQGETPPIHSEMTNSNERQETPEQKAARERYAVKLLLSAAVGAAVVAASMAMGAEPHIAILAGSLASGATVKGEELLRVGADVVKGAGAIVYDATGAVFGGVVEGSKAVATGLAEGGKKIIKGSYNAGAAFAGGLGHGTKEGLSGAAVITSRVTEHGNSNVKELHKKRQELESLTPESYRDEVITKYNEMAANYDDESRRTQALIDISLQKAKERGKNPDEVKGAIDALIARAKKERDKGEDKISMFLKLRRLMTAQGMKSALSGAMEVTDKAVYDYGFTHSRDRVNAKVDDAQKQIDKKREDYSRMQINHDTGEFVSRKGTPLVDYDADTQSKAEQIENMRLDQEVRTEYILDLIGGDSEEAIEALNKAVAERVNTGGATQSKAEKKRIN